MAVTQLAPAVPFPLPPDSGDPERLSAAYRTVIGSTESGKESRAALSSRPVRRYQYTASFKNAPRALRFRALWLTPADGSAQRLRFIVPLWSRGATPTGFPSAASIAGDFTHRFVGESQAFLWQSETEWELVDIASRTDSLIELDGDIAGSYVAGAALLLPAMAAWLDPPSIDLRAPEAERVPLVFVEEIPGVAGGDPAVGLATTPTVVTVLIKVIASGTAWTGRKFTTYEAYAFDAAGVVIPGIPVTWAVTDLGAGAANIRITKPYDGRQLHIAFDGGTSTYFSITATAGGVTSPPVA